MDRNRTEDTPLVVFLLFALAGFALFGAVVYGAVEGAAHGITPLDLVHFVTGTR